jgi:hypothetical protein
MSDYLAQAPLTSPRLGGKEKQPRSWAGLHRGPSTVLTDGDGVYFFDTDMDAAKAADVLNGREAEMGNAYQTAANLYYIAEGLAIFAHLPYESDSLKFLREQHAAIPAKYHRRDCEGCK